MPYRIFNQSDAVFLKNSFEKEGFAHAEHIDLSVVFREKYSHEFLKIERLKPFLVEITPTGDNEKPFLSLVFAIHQAQVTRFCTKNYSCRAVKILDLNNIWMLPYPIDMEKIEENNKQFIKEENYE